MQPLEAPPAPAGPAGGDAPAPALESVEPALPRMSLQSLLCLVVQVALLDVFIYQGSGGLGYAALFSASGLLILVGSTLRVSPKLALCVGLLAVVAAKSAWQSDGLTLWFGFAVLFALASGAVGNSTQLPELIGSCLASLRAAPGVAASAGRLFGHFARRSGVDRSEYLPILVPAAVTLAFLGVFGLANTVLSSWLQAAWAELTAGLARLYELLYAPERLLVWLGFALVAAVLAFPRRVVAARLNRLLGRAESRDVPGSARASNLLARTARNTLIGVNLLFLAYNGVDVVYLWVRRALPAGTCFSDYARGGVFWLAAALALTSLVLGAMFSGPLGVDARAAQLKKLAIVWVAQNLLLALLACQRLAIYFSFNGLTEMRIVGACGIAAVVAGLLIVTLKLLQGRSLGWIVRQQLTTLALFALALFALPIGALVSGVNADRILAAETLEEVAPAVIISHHVPPPEGLPGLVPLLYLDNARLPASVNRIVREGVAGVLLRELERLLRYQRLHAGWTYRELAIERALDAIEREETRLRELVPDGRSAERVRSFRELTQVWW